MATLAISGGTPVRNRDFPQWPVWDEREEELLLKALRSGVWGIGSAAIKEFEERFASICDTKFAISCTNGTDALFIALQALGIRAGDEVIIPPYTFQATATACLMCNAIPVFADIDPNTYNLDPEKFESAITERTRAVIPVHIAGNPAAMDRIMEIAQRHGLRVLEDAAQAHGAKVGDRVVGSIGDAGTFSFQSTKNISCGEGGAVVTNDEAIYDELFSFQNCGRRRGGRWYEHFHMAGNHRISAFQAAVLSAQLERLDEFCVRREDNAAYLSSLLREIGGVKPTLSHEGVTRSAYHLYIIRYKQDEFGDVPRDVFLKALAAEGIPCSEGYVPLYRLSVFQNLRESWPAIFELGNEAPDYTKTECPVCERVCRDESVWLMQNMLLGERSDMDDIAAAIGKIKDNIDELRSVEDKE